MSGIEAIMRTSAVIPVLVIDDAATARPLARVIQESLKKPLADEILFGALKDGGTVRVLLDREKDKLAFEFIPARDAKPRAPKGDGKKGDVNNGGSRKPAAQEDV